MTRGQRWARGAAGSAAAAVLLAAAVGAPAHAADQTTHDPAHDVVRVDFSTGDRTPAPRTRSVDVRRFTTTHAHREVRLVVAVRELGEHIALQYRVRLPGRTLFGYLENESGTIFVGLADTEGREVCGGRVRGGVADGADTVTFTFPRGCAGSPRWVRTGALASTGPGDHAFYDDARRDRRPDEGDIELGPRVRRS